MNASPSNGDHPPAEAPGSTIRILGAIRVLALLSIVIAALGVFIASEARTILFVGLEMLLVWTAIVGIVHGLYMRWRHAPSYAAISQWILVVLGVVVLAKIALPGLQFSQTLPQVSVAALRLASVLLLAGAAILYFFTNYAWTVQGNVRSQRMSSYLRLCQVAYFACAVVSGVTFLFLSTQFDFSSLVGWSLIVLTLLLILEPWFRFAARLYLPKSQQGVPASVGESLLLDLLFGSSNGARNLTFQIENLLGGKIADVWVVQFLRETAEPIVFAGLLLAWLSTCLTAVPLGSRGVLVSLGHYESTALEPGLHVSWPWPMGEIDLVQTEGIREISLGFDQDLAGPMLWTQPHFTGEQNLLVGDGESLLTVDVPIQYRISDAVAFLRTAADAPAALKSMAARKWTEVARSRASFQIMTTDREQMASELKTGLQAEVDRMGLGLQIVFVGLKDVHPPVNVAPAYEKVVSAQEEKEALIDRAKAYEASVLPDANAAAQRLVAEADAAHTQRIDQATGDAARFIALAGAEHDSPLLFRIRLRYDALDAGLVTPAKIVVGLSSKNLPATYLDLRSAKDLPVPAAPGTDEQPQPPVREHPKELPEE